ncbi:hypothetical protein GCM10010359_13720 [Streptomyces morookaense]|nr:hypothetical protein GCM10010359_13720 [Streptomyces morookaense]
MRANGRGNSGILHTGRMRIELATQPGVPGRRNEDFASVGGGADGAFVLLDGVTPPEDGGTGCRHGVPWFVGRLGGALLNLACGERELPLADCLSAAIGRTAAAHRDTCDLTHRRTPQATVVIARWDAERVEYLVLSDSVLLLADGRAVRAVRDDRIERLAALGPVTDAHRNAEGGFFTAAADPAVAGRAVTGALPRAAVRAMAAMTDGASRWVEVFGEGDWADCLTLLAKEGPQALIDRVRAAELVTNRRLGKRHDDATALYVVP